MVSQSESVFSNDYISSYILQKVVESDDQTWMRLMMVNKTFMGAVQHLLKAKAVGLRLIRADDASGSIPDERKMEFTMIDSISYLQFTPSIDVVRWLRSLDVCPIMLDLSSYYHLDDDESLKEIFKIKSIRNIVYMPSHSCKACSCLVNERTLTVRNGSSGALFRFIQQIFHVIPPYTLDSFHMDISAIRGCLHLLKETYMSSSYDFEVDETFAMALHIGIHRVRRLIVEGADYRTVTPERFRVLVEGLHVEELYIEPSSDSDAKFMDKDSLSRWDLAFATLKGSFDKPLSYWPQASAAQENSFTKICVPSLHFVSVEPFATESSIMLLLPHLLGWFSTEKAMTVEYRGAEPLQMCRDRLSNLPRVFVREFGGKIGSIKLHASLPHASPNKDTSYDSFVSSVIGDFKHCVQRSFLSFGYEKAVARDVVESQPLSGVQFEMTGFGKTVHIRVVFESQAK